ncbi:MAG: gliding motility-associated C-terminal domain-containing protein [Bacteroidales bacterium]|nr:gliding motility-associated C-terminal domain-containing protein [Bacteroidales bacterium]
MKNYNNIGQFVKEKLKGYREKPDDHVWQNLEKNLSTTGTTATSNISWWAGAVGVVAISSVIYFAVLKENPEEKTKMPQQTHKEQVEDFTNHPEKPIPETDKKAEKVNIASSEQNTSTESRKNSINGKNREVSNHKAENTGQISTIDSKKTNDIEVADKQKQTKSIAFNRSYKKIAENPEQDKNVHLTEDIEQTQPARSVEFSEDLEVCAGEDATLWASGGKSYLWSNGSTDSIINIHPRQSQRYTVSVVNDADEQITHEFIVKVKECGMLYMPNAFTPNSDGYNDEFKAYGVAIESFRMQIMNKQGVIVFESASLNDGWDGKYKNRPAPAGVYLYRVVYTGIEGKTKTKTGTLTLIR